MHRSALVTLVEQLFEINEGSIYYNRLTVDLLATPVHPSAEVLHSDNGVLLDQLIPEIPLERFFTRLMGDRQSAVSLIRIFHQMKQSELRKDSVPEDII